MPRLGGRPWRDRVMVSLYLAQSAKDAVEDLAAANGLRKAEAYRALLNMGLQRAEAKPAEFRKALVLDS